MLVDEQRATSLSALQLINQLPVGKREAASFGRRFRLAAGLVRGSDTFGFRAAFARELRVLL
jgi:hypothetical protein